MQRLSTVPNSSTPKPEVRTLTEIRAGLYSQVQLALNEAWPQEAPLRGFIVELASDGIVLNVTYHAKRNLDSISIGLIEKQLRDELNDQSLELVVHRLALRSKSIPKKR